MHPVITQMCECVWMGPCYGTTHFWRTSLMYCQQSMMGFTSLSPHLQLKSHRSCLHSPAKPLSLFNAPVMPLPLQVLASPLPKKENGWLLCFYAFTCSFWVMCCPLSHKLVLSPQPTETLRGHHCPPWLHKQQKQKQGKFL